MRAAKQASPWFGNLIINGMATALLILLFPLSFASAASGEQQRVLSFSFANGSLLPSLSVDAPPTCPGNHTVCSFDDVLKDPTLAKDFNKKKAMQTRASIMRLLDILEEAARATGLVKGSLFYSGSSKGGEVTKRPILSLRKRRQVPTENLCEERIIVGEYPEVGRNENGEWRYLSGRQDVTYVYCLHEGDSCSSHVSVDLPRDVTRCAQKFSFTPMVVYDHESQKFVNERILLPCGCQCQLGRG